MKIKRRLYESLTDEFFIINIPIEISFRTNSYEEESVVIDLREALFEEIHENAEFRLDRNIHSFLSDMKGEIEDELNAQISIGRVYLNLERLKRTSVLPGIAYLEVQIDHPVDEGKAARVFNTLINNNTVNTEFTFTMEDPDYDPFDVFAELTKTDKVEIGGD